MTTSAIEDLVELGKRFQGYRIEREANGKIIMSPTKSKDGFKSAAAARQLAEYADRVGGGACDSSTGFAIGPNDEVRSPDAAWIAQSRIDALSAEEFEGFWPLSPDVVIEIRSASDRFAETVAAIDRFMARGSVYGVAIDPQTREVVSRGTPPAGLVLDTDRIIDAGERRA